MSPRVAPTITFLPNTATDHPQTSNFVDRVTAPLPVLPELVKAIPDLIHAVVKSLVGKDTPKPCSEALDPVKDVVPTVKTTWTEVVDGGDDTASEGPSMWPSLAAAHQAAPVAGPNPPTGFLSQLLLPRGHAGRQVTAGAGPGTGSEPSDNPRPSPP